MKSLQNYTIPELVESIHHRGVEWVGKTTRKQPLIDLLLELEGQSPLNEASAIMATKLLLQEDLKHPVPFLVSVARWYGLKLTSSDLECPSWLQRDLVRRLAPVETLPTLAKVVNYSTEDMGAMSFEQLKLVLEVIGLSWQPLKGSREKAFKLIQDFVVSHNRGVFRNLDLDTEGCDLAFSAYLNRCRPIPANMWTAAEDERVRHDNVFYPHVRRVILQRGFYEPNIRHTKNTFSGVYLCCKVR